MNVLVADSVFLQEARKHIAPRDLDFLFHRIPEHANDFHAVAQGSRDVVEVIRRADEKNARKVERQVEIVIDEVRVLRWVENLQHRGCWITRRTSGCHFINLVDHQHRISHLHTTKRLQNQSRHRSNVGAAMTANLGLVAHPANRDTVERARDRSGDRFTERRLARSGRADETKNRTMRISAAKLSHRQIFRDAFLRLFQSVVPAVERVFDFLQVDHFFGDRSLVPGKSEHPVEIGANDLILARRW